MSAADTRAVQPPVSVRLASISAKPSANWQNRVASESKAKAQATSPPATSQPANANALQAKASPTAEPPAKSVLPSNAIGTTDGWSDYIPRPELAIAPVARGTILIEAPPGQTETRRISGVLSLYINEHGLVDHVAPTGSSMPPEFETAAMKAFRDMTYSPGQLQGQAVKSRIRVEVVFDNTPLEDLALGPPQP